MLIGIDASRAALARHTGTETYAYRLLLALAEHASPALQLRLYTHQPPQQAPWPAGPHLETRVLPFPRLWTHLRLSAELALNPPDVLFVPAHVLPIHCPVPAVVTVHDLGYHYFPAAHTAFQRRYLTWSTRRHARVATHLIADSVATKADLQRFYHADPARITVVHLGRDETLCPTPADAVRAKYNLPSAYILYLGTLQPRKNLPRLLAAFAEVASHFPQHLVLAGRRGWLYEDLSRQVAALGLTGRVHFPGYVDAADKAALLSGATLYAFPSLYEGFGLPVLEAMACGTPVLTSRTSSLPEVAGDAAWLVDPEDVTDIAAGLAILLGQTEERERLRQRGFAQVQHFSWRQAAQQLLTVLTTAAQTRG